LRRGQARSQRSTSSTEGRRTRRVSARSVTLRGGSSSRC
jgi:hypothetical protein